MSCSVHDVVRLERRGIATVAVGTEPFRDEALEQARLLGMPDYRMTFVRHPIQLLDRTGVEQLADDVLAEVVRGLVASPRR